VHPTQQYKLLLQLFPNNFFGRNLALAKYFKSPMRSYTMLSEEKRFGNATLEKIGHLGDKWFVIKKRKGRSGDILLGLKKSMTLLYIHLVHKEQRNL
jgi:hypothetical protein